MKQYLIESVKEILMPGDTGVISQVLSGKIGYDDFEESDVYGKLYDYYTSSGAMPYGVASGRDEIDAVAWVADQVAKDLGMSKPVHESVESLDMYETAPPDMEDWIKKVKPDFEKRYGADWKAILYKTAWNKHNAKNLTESDVARPKEGPMTSKEGVEMWHHDGQLHRVDGPAVVFPDGSTRWLAYGKLHRNGGPAIEDANGTKRWFIWGEEYSQEEYNQKMSARNRSLDAEKPVKEAADETKPVVTGDGKQSWYKYGKLRREEYNQKMSARNRSLDAEKPVKEAVDETKPVVSADGKRWYKYGNLHRVGGPAVIKKDGSKFWYKDGFRHREDGPAIERPNGEQKWFLRGLWHREGGPAHIDPMGLEVWYKNGRKHRLDGPAEVHPDGRKLWFIDGEQFSPAEFKQRVAGMQQEPVKEAAGIDLQQVIDDALISLANAESGNAANTLMSAASEQAKAEYWRLLN